MDIVDLKNGTKISASLAKATMAALDTLAEDGLPGMLALSELHAVCKDSNYQVDPSFQPRLQKMSLLQPNGQPPEGVRNVVLSAISGDGFEMSLNSPVTAKSLRDLQRPSKPGLNGPAT